MLRLLAVVLVAVSAVACTSSTSENGPAECDAAGGYCRTGSGPCQGTVGPQDCDPENSPGGFFCCLPCPGGQMPGDGGIVTGCQ